MSGYLALLAGLICAAVGGELFVRGAASLAGWARIAPRVIGATLAAFATSGPELAVAISAASAGIPGIALGDALGANVFNIGLILGLALTAFGGIRGTRRATRRDVAVALVAPLVTGVLLFDGRLSRVDGLLLLAMFFAWLVAMVGEARRGREPAVREAETRQGAIASAQCAAGLACLALAGHWIVIGASDIARAIGLGELVIGATIVATGTTVPELATTLVARLRGQDEIGLGTVLGSNLFNGLFIVAVAAIIHPIAAEPGDVVWVLGFGLLVVACAVPDRAGALPRSRGPLLLVLHALYLAIMIGAGRG